MRGSQGACDHSHAVFCELCEDACPLDALDLTQESEIATDSREMWRLFPLVGFVV